MAEEENEEVVSEIPTITAQELLERVEIGAGIYSDLSTSFIQEKLIFYGKSLFDWASEMTIEIPQDLNEDTYRRKLAEVGNKLQRASNYYSAAVSMEETVSGGSKISKNDIIRAIVKDYQDRGARRPAGTVIESLADSYMAETISTRIAAKIVKDFWRKRMDAITEVKGIIEQIGISLHVEAKHLTR
jgi:hypothetical protein